MKPLMLLRPFWLCQIWNCPDTQKLLRFEIFLLHFKEESDESWMPLALLSTPAWICSSFSFNSAACRMTAELWTKERAGLLLQSKSRHLIILQNNCSYSETVMICVFLFQIICCCIYCFKLNVISVHLSGVFIALSAKMHKNALLFVAWVFLCFGSKSAESWKQ